MNITFLIGNGFDLNQNLKTKYTDFYKYLCREEYSNKNIEKFKSLLNENCQSENWSDLELFLGELTEKIPENISDRDFFNMLLDIKTELIIFLENEEKKFELTKINDETFDDFINTIIFYDNYLENAQKRRRYKNLDKEWNLNFITFNYTNILDNIIERAMLKNYKRESSISIRFNQPIHVHGTISQNVILGVDNRKQISQKILSIEESFTLMSIIKPELNSKNHTDTDILAKNKIESSDVICIYGMSLGKTDQTWWKIILETLMKSTNRRLYIFYFDDTFTQKFTETRVVIENKIHKNLFSNKSIQPEIINKLKSQIEVILKNDLFDFKK